MRDYNCPHSDLTVAEYALPDLEWNSSLYEKHQIMLYTIATQNIRGGGQEYEYGNEFIMIILIMTIWFEIFI